MPKVVDDVNTFLASKGAQAIYPVPAPGPNQRGPSCGFYALAYVLKYWHDRLQLYGGTYATQKPLPARTNLQAPKPQTGTARETLLKEKRSQAAAKGQYTSLRHFGKFNRLTVLGSVFDADHLAMVARGENSQYAGQFDATVVPVSPESFPGVVKKLLDWECPVIVPYDVSIAPATEGEPVKEGGDAAHWVTLIGWFADGADDYAVYFNWGSFYFAKLQAFAVSNAQLTSNRHLTFGKYEIADSSGQVVARDYMRKNAARETRKNYNDVGWNTSIARLGKRLHNPEFTDPTEGGRSVGRLDDKDGRARLMTGGLRNKVVAVYRREDSKDIAAALM